MNKLQIKTPKDFEIMKEGGKLLNKIKNVLVKKIKIGVNAKDIDDLAEKLILESGGKPSFKMVPHYKWSTCINVNEGVVHGIPHKEIVFKEGDLVSLDIGMYYKGFHTDTSISLGLNTDKKINKFLGVGREAFNNAVLTIIPNKSYIYDISLAIEKTLDVHNLNPILDLTGHGIGKKLHEYPYVPCFVEDIRENTLKIIPGMAIAVEVMYTFGKPDLIKASDGWTIKTKDGKIAGLFEDTVIVTENGYQIIT